MARLEWLVAILLTGCEAAFGLTTIPDPSIDAGDASADADLTDPIGCADGTREGFVDIVNHPNIAACAGMWNQPGLPGPRTGHTCHDGDLQPCAAVDVCAPGWVICANKAAVAIHGAAACDLMTQLGFYVTRQGSSGSGACIDDANADNDLFGCDAPIPRNGGIAGCAPLNATSGDMCSSIGPPWVCSDGSHELTTVVKVSEDNGGVLCCKH